MPRAIPGIREYLWPWRVIDKWIADGEPFPGVPTNPLQEEAKALCQKKDHSWLFSEKFQGIAYSSKDEARTAEHAVQAGWRRTCYFCGFSRYVPCG